MKASLRLDHVGIAVRDLEEAREQWKRILGLDPSPIEEVPSEHVRISFFALPGCRIELLEPTAPESPIQKFLDRGRSGVHHLSLAVEGTPIAAVFEHLASLGVPAAGGLRPGGDGATVFFLKPSAASSVLVEFQQPAPDRNGE